MNARSREITLQLIGLVVVLVVIYFILSAVGLFNPVKPGENVVEYRVQGSTGAAVVTYTQEDGTSSGPVDVTLPWHKKIRFDHPETAILTAGNPSQTGTIKCIMYLNGELWKQEGVTAPKDKVSCAGIVP